MKLRLMAAFVTSAVILSGSALAEPTNGAGTINFTGSITESGCNIVGSRNIEVPLGNVAKGAFGESGSTQTYKNFDIVLEKCPATQGIKVNFSGTQDSTNPNLLAINQGTEAATGVGIEIRDHKNTPIKIGDWSSASAAVVDQGSITLTYNAGYKSTVANDVIKPGKANATSNFTVSYE